MPRPLSARQHRILVHLANGHTNQAIATREGIATKNVSKNITALSRKLGARGRTHAVALALLARILRPDDIDPPTHT